MNLHSLSALDIQPALTMQQLLCNRAKVLTCVTRIQSGLEQTSIGELNHLDEF
jgi:hypothetical protein